MKLNEQYFTFVLVIIAIGIVDTTFGLRELRLLGQLPMTGSAWPGGMACLPPVKMALEDINARPGILDDYELKYDYIDSMCNRGASTYRTFRALHENPPYVMLLGSACSSASESTAEVSHYYNITQLAYAASSPILSDRKRFRKFFRLSAPDTTMIPTRIDIMRTFNWKKIATIHEALEFFSVSMDDFIKDVQKTDIEIISQEVFVHDPFDRVKNLKDRDARIIVAGMYEDKARMVLCAAFKVGLFGPKVVWILQGWFSEVFWKQGLESISCTAEELNQVAEGVFLIRPVFNNPIEERGIANMTNMEFMQRYLNHPEYSKETQSYDLIAAQCYDHIWLAALALNCADERLKAMGHAKTLDQFTYADADIGEEIFECMAQSSMVGTSGRISFHEGLDPNKIIRVERVQGGERVLIAYYRQDKQPSYFEWIEGALDWKDNHIPRDSTSIKFEEVIIPWPLYISMCVIAGIGMFVTVGLLAFNIVYRNNKFVKLSSPNINNVLLLGCFLCYITVFIKTTGTHYTSVCEARTWCFCLGFTITFGSLFSKTWRVYRIFTNKKLLRMTIKDYQLLGIIAILVGVLSVVLIIWEILYPHYIVTDYLTKEVYQIGNDEEVHPYVRVCFSENAIYFNLVIYIIEGTLLSFGAFLAWETRRVKIEALNDSQQIGLCLYNVVVLSAVGLTLSLVLSDQVVLLYGITSACLIIGTFVTQMVVFIPKIHAVHNKIETNGQPWVTGATSGTGGTFVSQNNAPVTSTTNTIK